MTLYPRLTAICLNYVFIISDNEPPIFDNVPEDMSLSLDGRSEINVVWETITATDNSGGSVTITSSHNSGDAFTTGSTFVTLTAVDENGNSASSVFSIVISGM